MADDEVTYVNLLNMQLLKLLFPIVQSLLELDLDELSVNFIT